MKGGGSHGGRENQDFRKLGHQKKRFFSERLIFHLFNKEVALDLCLLFIDFSILCLIITVFLLWKHIIILLDEGGFSILINSVLTFFITLIYRFITIFRTVLTENPYIPLSFDKFIFNIYYCPFLWILTVYFCNRRPVKTWIQRKVKENRRVEEEVVPEFQMAYISIGNPETRRIKREEETVISNLSVSNISVVF